MKIDKNSARAFSNYLIDLLEAGEVDACWIAKSLILYFSEDKIADFVKDYELNEDADYEE